ncbi:MAG: hypothetical protein NVS3B1_19680 [Marmoricola sp.]
MATLPTPEPGSQREYHTMDNGTQVYSWHYYGDDSGDGAPGHADLWQPGIGWIVASASDQAHFTGWDRDPDITPITADEAEAYAPTAGYKPEHLASIKADGDLQVCQRA